MRKKYDAVATIGKYKDGQGNEKKRYITCGAIFEDDQGRMALKLDAVPTNPEWSGWLSFYEPKDGNQRQAPPRQDAHNQAKSNGYQPQRDNSAADIGDADDIPFAKVNSWKP